MTGPRRRSGWWWRLSQRGRGAIALSIAAAVFVAIFAVPLLVMQLLSPSFAGDPSIYARLQPGPPASGGPQAMRMKLVVVDTATGRMDPVWGRVPWEMQATSPSEVGTVVQLSWGESLSGNYDDNPAWPAYSSTVDVTVLDVASGATITRASFANAPPATRPAGVIGETVASRPEDQVATYLRGLPSQGAPLTANTVLLLVFVAGWVMLFSVLPLWLLLRARRVPRKATVPAPPRRS